MNADPVAMANAFLEQTIPRAYEMGIRFSDLRPGRAQARLPFEGNGNHFGTVYAGVVFTLAEVLGGALHLVTFDPTTHYPLVRAMSIDFVAPGRGPLTAVAELDDGTVERVRAEAGGAGSAGKASFELRASVTGDDGTVVATTVGSYQIRPYGR